MKDNSKLILILSLCWAAVLVLLGGWWIHLFLRVNSGGPIPTNFIRMITWEGSFFFLTLFLISASLLGFYWRGLKKAKELQDFFSSITHELKTPLASIRLQSEVVGMKLSGISKEDTQKWGGVIRPLERLVQDSKNLENQLDKILQLSRLERTGSLDRRAINLLTLFKKTESEWGYGLNIQVQHDSDVWALGDEFGIELILRNLFENTRQHSPEKDVVLTFTMDDKWTRITYRDHGNFQGDTSQIANLFYRHNSKRGSGIGLYLTKKLVKHMQGEFKMLSKYPFTIQIALIKTTAPSQ
ncbi:MAG: HAMP domain-containing histidine kinase [Bdellovibrio sp.]|nr:HAMP domain-containing histidine kinase [Bdellovibrio sp.]